MWKVNYLSSRHNTRHNVTSCQHISLSVDVLALAHTQKKKNTTSEHFEIDFSTIDMHVTF